MSGYNSDGSFIVECPCCGERLELDRKTCKILRRWPRPEIKEGEDAFQSELKRMEEEKARLESVFDEAGKNLKAREDRLAAAFEQQKKKIIETGDLSRPESPFDLD